MHQRTTSQKEITTSLTTVNCISPGKSGSIENMSLEKLRGMLEHLFHRAFRFRRSADVTLFVTVFQFLAICWNRDDFDERISLPEVCSHWCVGSVRDRQSRELERQDAAVCFIHKTKKSRHKITFNGGGGNVQSNCKFSCCFEATRSCEISSQSSEMRESALPMAIVLILAMCCSTSKEKAISAQTELPLIK